MEENIEKKPIKTVSKKSFIIMVALFSVVVVALVVGLVLALVLGGNKDENGNNGDNTPSIYESEDGYWVINGVKTNLKTNGEIDNGTVQDENPQGLDFFLNAGGTYTVAAGDAKLLTEIVIPSTYKGIPVTEIDAMGFGDQNSARPLVSITIPDSITKIGDNAFKNCTSLTSIEIPDSVTSIGNYAFYGCSLLTSIVIPDSVTSIGYQTFHACDKLVEVINNSSLNIVAGSSDYGYVGYYAKEVHKGESKIVNKDDYLFYAYSEVNYLVNYIGKETDLILPESYNGENYVINDCAFYNCTSLTSIVIPDSVTSIGKYAFYNCTSLESITIPFVGAKKDGTSNTHFGYLFGASSYNNNSSSVPTSLKTVVITGGTSIGEAAFFRCSSLTSIVIHDSVTSIGVGAFFYCSSLTSVVIGDSVTSIGRSAFSGCSSLTSVVIPDSVTSIGDSAFYGCSSLTSVVIPDSVTSIGDSAFYGCSSLTSIVIPDSVTSIGNSAFENCSSLTDVYYTGSKEEWAAISIGYYNDPLKNATIHYNYVPEE